MYNLTNPISNQLTGSVLCTGLLPGVLLTGGGWALIGMFRAFPRQRAVLLKRSYPLSEDALHTEVVNSSR